MKRFLFSILISCSLTSISFAQNKMNIDSLINSYDTQKEIEHKIETSKHIFSLLRHEKPEKVFEYANNTLKLSKQKNHIKGQGIAYYQIAYYYRFKPNIDSSRTYFKKAFEILEKNEYFEELCDVIDAYATFECVQGNYETSINIAEDGFKYGNKLKNGTLIFKSLSRKSTIYMDGGNLEAAAKENLLAIKVLDTMRVEDKLAKAIALGHSARIEILRKNYELTLQPLNKSLSLLKELDEKRWIAVTYIELGNAYWCLEDYDNALNSYNQSLEISKEIKRDDFISINLSNIASLYSENGNHDDAIKILKQSIEVEKKIGSLINLSNGYNFIGSAYYNSKQYNEAIKNHSLAIHLSDSIKALYVKREGYSLRSKAYNKVGNYKAALSDIKDYVKLQDSIFNTESAKQIDELKTQYETEKKEAEIVLQQKEIKTLNQEVEISNLRKGLYAGGMISFIALSGLLYFGFKQREKKNKIEREKQEAIYKQEIAFKKKELASETLHLVQKNTFIQELKENLERIKKSPELFKVEFRRLVMLLKKESAEDKDWEVFKSYFSEVHNNFDHKLKAIYEDISEKEMRLASFLRMNLSTKEIASMLNVLPESVLKSKYRLKKKLRLDKETDLNHFLSDL